jgi:hypothetical protein
MSNEAENLLTNAIKENQGKIKMKMGNSGMRIPAGVIGVGAGGGNIAHLMSSYGYLTAAFNTAEADMADLRVGAKVTMKNVNGSGKDRAFAATEFKRSFKSFFEHDMIKEILDNDLIFIVGTGGGGTGTVISVMIAGYLKNEYPEKTIFAIGILGSIKEDLISQKNMKEFISDLENKTNCPYMLFDNNRVKNKFGDDVYDTVNQDVVNSIRILSKEYFLENSRSNIDGRDYARLTSYTGLTSVVSVDNLNISVADEDIDLIQKIKQSADNSSAIVTQNPDAYGFFMNTSINVYSRVDTTFDDVQLKMGKNLGKPVFKHLQNSSGNGPEFAVIMTGMQAPIERFNLIEKRIEEYEKVTEKNLIPSVERDSSALKLAGDGRKTDVTGKGDSFLGDY